MSGPPGPTIRQRLRIRVLVLGVAMLRRLPDQMVYRSAYAIGAGLSVVMADRRSLVRANLHQVCLGLAARGLASNRVHRALADPGGLDRMVRAAFGHWALAYVESALTLTYSSTELRRRVRAADDPATSAALSPGTGGAGRIFVSPHFGCVELAARYASSVAGLRLTAPMETVGDPALQSYLERTRSAGGVKLIPIRGAAIPLRDALSRGEAVALVADRAIGGSGIMVDLFGVPARLPLGPAVLALESDVSVFVVGIRRTGWGQWASRVERLPPVGAGRLRTRIRAGLEAQARAFERIVADAPEQWWTVLFPIWEPAAATDGQPDAAPDAAPDAPARRAARTAARSAPRDPLTMGRADLHIHSLASDGVSSVEEILDAADRAALDVIAITDHERIDAALAAQRMAAATGRRVEVIVGEEISTRSGHLIGLFLDERIRPWQSLRTSVARIHDQGGLAIVAHPLVPYPLCASAGAIMRLLDEQDPIFHPDGIEALNPTTAGMRWTRRVPEFVAQTRRAAIGGSDAHRAQDIGRAVTTFAGSTATELRLAILDRTTGFEGTFYPWSSQLSMFRLQLEKNVRALRDDVRGKLARDGTGRDLGYPGGRLRPPSFDERDLR